MWRCDILIAGELQLPPSIWVRALVPVQVFRLCDCMTPYGREAFQLRPCMIVCMPLPAVYGSCRHRNSPHMG